MYDSDRGRTFALFVAELFADYKEPKQEGAEEGEEGKNAVLADAVMSVLTMLCNEPLRNNRINLNAAADAIKVRQYTSMKTYDALDYIIHIGLEITLSAATESFDSCLDCTSVISAAYVAIG